MSELLKEALKGIKEYHEWAKAPGEAAAMLASLSDSNEEVLYKGYAQYINGEKTLDTTKGVFLVTDRRIVYLSKKRFLPFVKVTERLVIWLKDMSEVQIAKHGLGHRLQISASGRKHYFLLVDLHTFATQEDLEKVANLVETARQRVRIA